MEQYADVIIDPQGNVVVGAMVSILDSQGAPAQIFGSNNQNSSINNPILTGSLGEFSFFARNGRYRIGNVSVGGRVFQAGYREIILNDPDDGAGGLPGRVGTLESSVEQLAIEAEAATQALDALQLPDYAALRAYKGPRKSVYVTGAGIAGMFVRDDADTASADNGGTVIVAGGKRFKRVVDSVVDVRWFGAKGDGVADDTVPFQKAVTYCVTNRAALDLPNKYKLTGTIDCAPNGVRTGLLMRGRGMNAGQITTNFNGVLFKHCENLTVVDLQVINTAGPGTASQAFATPNNIQAAHCSWTNVQVTGFKYGFVQRYSIWNSWYNVITDACTCGFRFARNNDMYNQANPVATTIWNLDGGWFHNMNTFTNVLCQGGEVGVYGSLQGAVFDGLTTQGQKANVAGNTVLPLGEPGTGVWIDAGKANNLDLGWNNIFSGFYAETTERPFHFVDQRQVKISNFFIQGAALATPFPCVLKANNSTVFVDGGVGQDYFTNKVQLSNGATVTGNVPSNAAVPANAAVVDATSKYRANGNEERFVQHYLINKPNGSSGQVYTVPLAMPDFSVYDIDIIASEDGYLQRRAAYKVSRYTGAYTPVIDLTAGVAGPWTLAAVDTNAEITFSGSEAVVMHLIVRRLSDISSSTVALAPK